MTLDELLIAFDQQVNVVQSEQLRSFLPEEKVWWLNQSVDKWIKRHVDYMEEKTLNPSLKTSYRNETLGKLLTKISLPVLDNSFVELPGNFKHFIDAEAFITCGDIINIVEVLKTFSFNLKDSNNSFQTFELRFKKLGTTVFVYKPSFITGIGIPNDLKWELLKDLQFGKIEGIEVYVDNYAVKIKTFLDIDEVSVVYTSLDITPATMVSEIKSFKADVNKYINKNIDLLPQAYISSNNPFINSTNINAYISDKTLQLRKVKKVRDVLLHYIREPIPISFTLQRSIDNALNAPHIINEVLEILKQNINKI